MTVRSLLIWLCLANIFIYLLLKILFFQLCLCDRDCGHDCDFLLFTFKDVIFNYVNVAEIVYTIVVPAEARREHHISWHQSYR